MRPNPCLACHLVADHAATDVIICAAFAFGKDSYGLLCSPSKLGFCKDHAEANLTLLDVHKNNYINRKRQSTHESNPNEYSKNFWLSEIAAASIMAPENLPDLGDPMHEQQEIVQRALWRKLTHIHALPGTPYQSVLSTLVELFVLAKKVTSADPIIVT